MVKGNTVEDSENTRKLASGHSRNPGLKGKARYTRISNGNVGSEAMGEKSGKFRVEETKRVPTVKPKRSVNPIVNSRACNRTVKREAKL
jgi:hypothetical protein